MVSAFFIVCEQIQRLAITYTTALQRQQETCCPGSGERFCFNLYDLHLPYETH